MDNFNGSLLHNLADRGGDELHAILVLLSPAERANARLISRIMCKAASADTLWTPLLSALGFTAEGLRAWAESSSESFDRPAHELYGRVHSREVCEVEMARRCQHIGRWWAECALDLLNPYDQPVWLLFSPAADDVEYSEVYLSGGAAAADEQANASSRSAAPGKPAYLQPTPEAASCSTPRGAGRASAAAAAALNAANAGRVSLRTASGPPCCRGYRSGAREVVLLRFDVQRDDVPYDEILADGVASLTGVGASAVHPNGPGGVAEMAAENPPPLTGAVGVEGNGDTGNGGGAWQPDGTWQRGWATWLAVDAIQLPARRFLPQPGDLPGFTPLDDDPMTEPPVVVEDADSTSDESEADFELDHASTMHKHGQTQVWTQARMPQQQIGGQCQVPGASEAGGRRGDASAKELDLRTITIEKHFLACAPPTPSELLRPFMVDVALVTRLSALSADDMRETPLDESVDFYSHHGAKVPTSLPHSRPWYVVNASSHTKSSAPFFPWERRMRCPGAIAGKAAFEPSAAGGSGAHTRWCRQATDPNLVRLEHPRVKELRMTLLRSTRIAARVAPSH